MKQERAWILFGLMGLIVINICALSFSFVGTRGTAIAFVNDGGILGGGGLLSKISTTTSQTTCPNGQRITAFGKCAVLPVGTPTPVVPPATSIPTTTPTSTNGQPPSSGNAPTTTLPVSMPEPVVTAPALYVTSPCSYIQGFASSCVTPSDPSTGVVAFSNSTATSATVSFTINILPPAGISSTSSAVWSNAYYWSQAAGKWISFTLTGTPYTGTTCSSGASGCWLGSVGSANLSVASSVADNGSLFILTYDKEQQGNGWQGPACAAAPWGSNGLRSCWRLSIYPPTSIGSLVWDVESTTSVQSIVSAAENSGYIVKVGSGTSSVEIDQPFTHKIVGMITGVQY